MKNRLSWVGRVESIRDSIAYVTLAHRATGNTSGSQCQESYLSGAGIGMGDEFLCFLTKVNTIKLRKLKPRPITKERAKEIKSKMEKLK